VARESNGSGKHATVPEPLSAGVLPGLSGVQTPAYDRTNVTAGVVHIGVGAFHRAHQAMFHDRLLAEGAAEWGIHGVGVLPADARMRDALGAQDGLYTLVERGPDGDEGRVIGSITGYELAPDDPEAVIERLAAATTRIVSLTVTEGGYNISDVTGEFDPEHRDVVHDLEAGEPPRTTFGLVAEALHRRRERGTGPFTVMSCDNLPHNGRLARMAFTTYARLRDPGLAAWMDEHVAFPNSMVDRITPATTDEDRRLVAERFGIEDRWPVVCEPFVQWVLEDEFCAGRPRYEDVGVQVVADVTPYELMKLRLLNASHQAIAYLGHLCGYELVHDAAQDEAMRRFLHAYMEREGAPTLPPVPGVDVAEYEATLLERFSNPAVRDTIPRLCAESSDRIPKWLVPVIRENLERDGEIERSAAVVASWVRYAEGEDEQGRPIEVVDNRKEQVIELAGRARDGDPDAFIANRDLFGDLAESERFMEAYRRHFGSLHERGARATLDALAEGG
jgi:mannitol 2-dehydrogenase